MDSVGRYFYICEGGLVWSPGWKPCKTVLDEYECRHGLNYTRITGAKNKVRASVLHFVPLGVKAEIQRLTLTNLSDETKHIKLFSYAEWCLWNAATDGENFQRNLSTGEVEVEVQRDKEEDQRDKVSSTKEFTAIYHKTEYKERRNHYAYYAVNCAAEGYDTDRESFVGLYNELSEPEAVLNGHSTDSIAHGWSPIASHYIGNDLGICRVHGGGFSGTIQLVVDNKLNIVEHLEKVFGKGSVSVVKTRNIGTFRIFLQEKAKKNELKDI